jgi:hypothetical protein
MITRVLVQIVFLIQLMIALFISIVLDVLSQCDNGAIRYSYNSHSFGSHCFFIVVTQPYRFFCAIQPLLASEYPSARGREVLASRFL